MAFSLRGAMAGLGGAMEVSGLLMLKETLEEQRQTRLMEVQQVFQSKENELNRGLTREEGAAGRLVTREEGSATRASHEKTSADTRASIEREGAAGRAHTTTENAASRSLQAQLAELHEKGASARHGASMSIQKAQLDAVLNEVKLMPLADGTFQKVKKDGTVLGLAIDPDTQTPLQGPKDVAATTQLLVKGNTAIITGLMEAHAKESDEKAKASLMERVQELQRDNNTLLGRINPKTAPGSQIVDPFKKKAAPAAPSVPGGVNSLLTPQDQAKISAAPSPAARTQMRQGLLNERMREAQAGKELEGQEEEDRLRALGIEPGAAAFSVR